MDRDVKHTLKYLNPTSRHIVIHLAHVIHNYISTHVTKAEYDLKYEKLGTNRQEKIHVMRL